MSPGLTASEDSEATAGLSTFKNEAFWLSAALLLLAVGQFATRWTKSSAKRKAIVRDVPGKAGTRMGGSRRKPKAKGGGLVDEDEQTDRLPCKDAVAADEHPTPGDEQSVEAWEVPLESHKGPATEAEKALLRVTKKLREVKNLLAKQNAGETLEQNQLVKVGLRADLLKEWLRIHADVQWERENGGGGVGGEFVTVEAGVAASRLRSTASRLAQAEAAAEAELVGESASAEVSEGKAEGESARTGKSRHRRKKDADARRASAEAEDESGWETVKSKKDRRQEEDEERVEYRQGGSRSRLVQRVMSIESDEYRLTRDSVKTLSLFTPAECEHIESLINQVVVDAERGLFKPHSVDLTPMRNKYFFGFAYTYGAQKEHPGAHGTEAVWPPEDTSEIPAWIQELIIDKLEAKRLVPKGWINAATINDYAPGGCIVSHIDPPHLFDRPITSVSFFSDCNLVFGTRFSFPKEAIQEIETSVPILVHPCLRGEANVLKGYSADKITHAIRPCDIPSRRASIILRRVLPSAPVLANGKVLPLSDHLKQRA